MTANEIVLNYDRDEILFNGTELPFSLTAAQPKAVIEHHHSTVVTLTLAVDQLRTIAPAPEPTVSIEKPHSIPTPDEQFEQRLNQIRKANTR